MVREDSGTAGALFEVFVHAEWSPDDEYPPDDGESTKVDDDETEKEGQRRYAEGLLGACSRKAAPLLSWQAGKDLGLGILGGGMHGPAARARALLRPAWSLLLSPTCQCLAVSHDGGVTLLSADNEFSSPKGEWEAAPATGPMAAGQWRRMGWSRDGVLLAVSDAYGRASLLSHQGLRPLARMQAVDTDCPVADLGFLPAPAPPYTLASLSFDGMMYTMPFTLSKHGGILSASSSGITPPPPLSLSPWHTNISCMTVSHKSGLLAFGGWDAPSAAGGGTGTPPSVTLWRVKDENSLQLELVHSMASGGGGDKGVGLVGRMLAALSGPSNSRLEMDRAVVKLRFSPSGRQLAVLEACGALFILDCIALKMAHKFTAQELCAGPGADDWSRAVCDAEWWDDTALVLARRNGHVTANELKAGLPNIGNGEMGEFHFMPCLTSAVSNVEGGMFVLECRRRYALREDGEVPGAADVTPSSEAWYARFLPGGAMTSGTRAKGESFLRKYRLVSVFRSTAERLLQRRIEKKEYLAALELARAYGLSTDAVYMSQWLHTEVTRDSIHALLPKIDDRAWVLQQCVTRIPGTAAGAKALLEYGLGLCAAQLEDTSPLDDVRMTSALAPCKKLFEQYLDRFQVFAEIYPGERLDPARFKWFCESSVVAIARMFAVEENTTALTQLLQRYPDELTRSLFTVLDCIPETTRPRKYDMLLPHDSDSAREWCSARARDIEARTGLVDNALELLECAQSKGVGVDVGLMQRLGQLNTLVYECGADVSLSEYERTGDSEKLKLFTHNSTRETFVEDLRTRAAPYLSSLGARGESLLHEHLVSIAEDRIDWCAEVFDASKITEPLFALTTREHGSGWLPIIPCYFCAWAPPPPDCLEGRVSGDIILVRHDGGPIFDQIASAVSAARRGLRLAVVLTTDAEARASLVGVSQDGEVPEACPPVCVVTLSPSQQQAYCANPLVRVCRRRVLHDPVVMLDLALQCVYRYKGLDQLDAINTIYTSLPERNATLVGRVVDEARYAELQDKADLLDKHLTANEILERYRLAKPMPFFLTCADDLGACKGIVRSMCRGLVRQQVRDVKVWRALKQDLVGPPSKSNPHGGLMVAVFGFMPKSTFTLQYLESLLEANMFDLAREEMQAEIDNEGVEDGESDVSLATCVAIVLKVARDDIDSAASVHDKAWENAQNCIDLVPDEEDLSADTNREEGAVQAASWLLELRAEKRLMQAVELLAHMKVELLPVQVREATDKLSIMRKAMNDCPTVCRDPARLLDLARLLGLTEPTSLAQVKDMASRMLLSELEGGGAAEDKVLLEKSIKYVFELMDEGYAGVWDLCENLASSEGFAVGDAQKRLEMARFALLHCEVRAVDRLLSLCGKLQCRVDAGEGTLELARKRAWGALDEWNKGIERDSAWGSGVPRDGVLRHAWYHFKKPRCAECLSDIYWGVHERDDHADADLYSIASQARLAEGLSVVKIAWMAGIKVDLVATSVLQRLAMCAAQADAHVMMGALFGIKRPQDVAQVFTSIMLAHVHAGDKAAVKRVELTARLASAFCAVMEQSTRSGSTPIPLSQDLWAQATSCTDSSGTALTSSVEVMTTDTNVTPLGELLAQAAAKGEQDTPQGWGALRRYYEALPAAVCTCVDQSMVWTLRVLCDATADVASFVDDAVAQDNVDSVCRAAEGLRKALGGDAGGVLTSDGVRSRLAVKLLRSEGADALPQVQALLRTLAPAERLRAAKELIAGGGVPGDVCGAVLDVVVEGSEGEGLQDDVRKLRSQADDVYRKRVQEEFAVARTRLDQVGVPLEGLPDASGGEDALCEYICKAAPSASSETQLSSLASLCCLWDPSLSHCLHSLTDGTLGRAATAPPPHSPSLPGGSIVGYATERPPLHGPRLWGTLCMRSAQLKLGKFTVALLRGPARGRIGEDAARRVATCLSEAGLRAHAVHSTLLGVGVDEALAQLCEVGGEDEGVEDLVETVVRMGLLKRVPQCGFAKSLPKLLGKVFPGCSVGSGDGDDERDDGDDVGEGRGMAMPYLVVPERGARSVSVLVRKTELLAIAVVQLCEATLHVYAGHLILEATGAPSLLRTTEGALAALQAYLIRACQLPQVDAQSELEISEGVQQRCKEALVVLEELLA